MGDVLIPVPEEHAEEFSRQMIRHLISTRMSDHEIDSVVETRLSLTDDERTVFDVICRASARRELLSCDSIAAVTASSVGEVYGLALNINGAFQIRDLAPCLVMEAKVNFDGGDGHQVENLIYIIPSLARRILAHVPDVAEGD